ncbi:MAG: tetratricopeptide repeat protein, partial [Candidatus Sericytochromatia bacterium]
VFNLHVLEDKIFVISEKKQSETLMEHLDKFHFTEDFEQEDITNNYSFLLVQGKDSINLVNDIFNQKIENLSQHQIIETIYIDKDVYIIARDEIGDIGFLIISNKDVFTDLFNELIEIGKKYDLQNISDSIMNVLRIEAGIPRYDVDISQENLVPETGLELTSVSYTKGCYLGQEVIARIKTYGTAPKALIGLEFEGDLLPSFDSEIKVNGKNIGIVKSSTYSPSLKKNISLVYLHKDFRKPDENIEFESESQIFKAKVKLLPFYKKLSDEELAQSYYDKALILFGENKEEEAIDLLNKAIVLKHDFPDAYESLGVILSRLERFEEAIEVMNKLTEVNPDEPMARTNLSIFYMKIGNKEEAEKQMALATTIKFRLAMKESKSKKALEEKKKQEIEAIKERMEMFKEVLDTEDSEDLIANYGMGKSHFDLEEYQDAIQYFEKAVKVKKDYSIAYLYLGKSLENTNNKEKALEIYKIGITVASQKGDLMPLKEM